MSDQHYFVDECDYCLECGECRYCHIKHSPWREICIEGRANELVITVMREQPTV